MGPESEVTSEPRSGVGADQLKQSSGSYELVLSAVLFGAIGLWIDRQAGTTPLFVVIFTIAGLAGATISLYYRYRHRIAEIQAETAALTNTMNENRS